MRLMKKLFLWSLLINNTGNSGMAMTTTPAGGSEDQGLNIYAAHLVMASA